MVESKIGQKIGHIRIVEVLARGGMGDVYVGVDETLERRVAVKAVRSEFRLAPEAKQRFLAEARTLSQLDHPNICQVHDFLEGDHCDYLVLELVEGCSLRGAIADGLKPAEALAIARQLLDVLAAVHERGVVHRDLKPDNVMVTATNQVKVLDFGLARSATEEEPGARSVTVDALVGTPAEGSVLVKTRLGTVVGTAGYMSPEQARGEPATAASDVYAVGLILQELLTGRPAFPRELPPAALVEMAATGQSLRATGLSPDLELFIERLKSPAPAARPSAQEAARELAEILARPRRRRRRVLAASLAALVLLAAAVPLSLWWRERARAAARASLAQRFAAEARDAEWLMRVAHMLPRHDIRPAKAEVRQRIAALQEEMERIGALAAGPGHYAVGRGLLALRDYAQARAQLEVAWHDGYQTPEVACALGTALGGLYRQELELAGRITDPAQREARRTEIARSLGRPALEYQRLGRDARLLPSQYVAALIAFHEERFDDAIALAKKAAAAVPWFYEANLIAARGELELGERRYRRGELDSAFEHYQRALDILAEVRKVAPSDASGHAFTASVWNAIALVRLYGRKGDVEEAATHALEACDDAEAVDAESLAAITARSTAHLAIAVAQARRKQPNADELRLAETAAERAVKLGPDSTVANFNLGFLREHTGDLEGAAADYRRALELDPSSARIHNNLGHVYRQLGRFDEATAELEKAIALEPHLMVAYENLANVLLYNTGRIREGIQVCRRQLAVNDDAMWGHLKLAQALMFLGDLEQAQGEAERARAITGDDPDMLWTLVSILRLKGAYREALEPLQRYLKVTGHATWGYYLRGVIYDDLGDTATARRDFETFLRKQRESLETTPSSDLPRYGVALGLARLGRIDEALAEGRRARDACSRGEDVCSFDYARVLAVCGHEDEAITELRRAFEAGYRDPIWTRANQDFESLAGDERFNALLAEMTAAPDSSR